MPITPDDKNWTWVIERTCGECGYDASRVDEHEVSTLIRQNAAAWPGVLARATVAERPDDSTWSPLEYAAHVRDVFRVFAYRLQLMIETDNPLYPDWKQDATALEERYNEQDPAVVEKELLVASFALAAAFDEVADDAWQRHGRRSDGADFTVAEFAKYLAHDPIHHLWDVSHA